MKPENILIPGDPRADEAMRRWEDLKTERSQHELDWHDLARLIRPQRGGFGLTDFTGRTVQKPLSSAPIVAQTNFASGLYGTLTNPANRWCALRTPDPELAQFQPVKLWLDQVTDRVLASFRPSVSPFYSAAVQLYSDITTFGNAAQYDEMDEAEGRIMDVTLSLAEVVWDIDGYGQTTEIVRKFMMKPRAAMKMFGNLPPKIAELAEKGSQTKTAYYHHIHKNMDWRKGALGPRGKRWLSTYVCEEGRSVLSVRGYAEMPFHVPRWEVESGAICGTGPGFIALAGARVLEQMKAANIRSGQRAADPTLLAPDRNAWPLNGVAAPGKVIYNGTDMRGNALVRPLDNFGQTGLTLEMQQREIEEIQDAFHSSLMTLAGRTGMTATEVMERQEEKLRLMAPHLGRVQEEFLAPKIRRRFQMLWRAGQLPPPPPEAAGSPIDVHYTSAAAMAQKSAEGASIVRMFQDVTPIAQVDPGVMDKFSVDDMVDILAEARGLPARALRGDDEVRQMREARAQQAQQQQMLDAAQQGGAAMRDMAGAAQMMEGQG